MNGWTDQPNSSALGRWVYGLIWWWTNGHWTNAVGWNDMISTRSFHRRKPLSHEHGSEWMSTASESSSAKQADEWAVRVNERADERLAKYSTRRYHSRSTHWCLESKARLSWSESNDAFPFCCFFSVSSVVSEFVSSFDRKWRETLSWNMFQQTRGMRCFPLSYHSHPTLFRR